MLHSMQHRGPDGAGFVIGETCQRSRTLEGLDLEGKKGTIGLGHVRLAITGEMSGVQPFCSSDGRLSLLHNGEIYNYRELMDDLDHRSSVTTGSDSEVLFRLIEQEYQGDLKATIERVLPKLDGVYALAITDQRQAIVARDRIGIRQLYYYESDGLVAFASEKKPLWALAGTGIDVHRVPPGRFMVLSPGERQLQTFWSPENLDVNRSLKEPSEAVTAYGPAIEEAVRKRVQNRDHVGIIFSGGIDSVLIAYLVQRLGVPLTCYTAGREGASDIETARRIADEFEMPLRVKTLSLDDIERMIPQVISVIEDHSLNQVEVALPIFASVRMAQEASERVILSGQGADELFGGYLWYATIIDREGYDHFLQRSWEDTFLLYKECLEREDKIAMAHSIELRVPFLDPKVIRVAFSIAPDLKIRRGKDSLGKRIHRDYGRSIGIPDAIAFRAKEAAQHGANVHTAFEELAQICGLSQSLLKQANYDPKKTVGETLGSSSRYGYRYGQQDLWEPLPHVQFYLDSHAARLGMLPPTSRFYWDRARRNLNSMGIELSSGNTK